MRADFRERYGPWALVAGAAEGLGAAFARALAEQGLDVLLLDRQAEPLAATAAAIRRETGARVETAVADLAHPGLASTLRAPCAGREIGLLVYNAAVSPIGGFLELPLGRALEAVDANCRGLLTLTHLVAGPMVARGRGGLVLVASLSADQGAPRIATYAATKAFTLVFGESLWGELRARGVDVLAIRPGAVRTPGWQASQPPDPDPDAPPPMEPDDVAAEALAALGGDDPSPVIGAANRGAAELLRTLPRRQTIEIMAAVTARLRSRPLD